MGFERMKTVEGSMIWRTNFLSLGLVLCPAEGQSAIAASNADVIRITAIREVLQPVLQMLRLEVVETVVVAVVVAVVEARRATSSQR